MNKLTVVRASLLKHKITVLLVLGLLFILGLGYAGYQRISAKPDVEQPLQEVDLEFKADGPYALLVPRRDGNAINLTLKRISEYEAFSYELVYSAEGIDRGAGSPNTYIEFKDGKGDLTQEILFGTCSKGNTSDPLHCVFDKGVENGTLTLRFKKGNIAYKMLTTWHLQKPDIALGKITSGDAHFIYTTTASRQELALTGYSVVNDLSGAPKLPEGKDIQGKVYAFNIPVAKVMSSGDVKIELADNPPAEAKIGRYVEGKNDWELLDTKIDGSNLTAKTSGEGIFTVLINKKAS